METQPLITSKSPDRWSIISALWIGSFLCAIDGTIVATTMTGIASEFNQLEMVSWIATSYLLTNCAFQPLYGKISDVFGRKSTLLFAQFWFGVGCLLCALSNDIVQFSIARAIAGIGGGGLSALSAIIVSDIVPLEERGVFVGYANLMFGVGQMLGGPLGGLLFETIGWRWSFAFQVPLIVVAMFLTVTKVNVHAPHIPVGKDRFKKDNLKRIDVGGSFTIVLAICSLLFVLASDFSNWSTSQTIATVTGVSSFIAFLYVEKYVAYEQIIPPFAFQGTLQRTALIAGFGTIAVYTPMFLLPLYLQIVQDFTPPQSGMFNVFSVVTISLGSLFTGGYIKRHGSFPGQEEESQNQSIKVTSNRVSLVAVIILFSGLLLFYAQLKMTSPESDHIMWKVVAAISLSMIGLGFGSFLVSLLVVVVAVVGKENQAVATGMNYLFRSIGSVLGTAISLNLYSQTVKGGLKEFFKGKENGDYYYKMLLRDIGNLKNGVIPPDLRMQILQIYTSKIAVSVIPALVFAALCIVLAIDVCVVRRKN